MSKFRHLRTAALLIASLFFVALNAQQKISVGGTIVDADSQEPLIGVTVIEKGTANGVATDFDGNFTIKVAPKATLQLSYVGYKPLEVKVDGNNKLNIAMTTASTSLDELVVIGYGVQRKSDVTGSISSISGKDVNDVPVASALQAMQGKASGVNIIQNSGAPGGNTTIKIRGTGTVNDSDPLYVVDGFIVDGIDHINPGDIANVEIFKDAASVFSRLRFSIEDDFTALMLMTDGVSDPMFETDRNLNDYSKWNEFWNKIKEGFPDDGIPGVDLRDDNPEAKDQLLRWMDFWSAGNHDDRTLAILY